MKLFSTTASLDLSKKVAKELGIAMASSETVRFDNSEVRVRVIEAVTEETCIVLGSSSNPTDTHLMELFFFADALKRAEAAKIIGILPYFGYARQNIQHRVGECVSVNVVIRFLETVGYDEIATFELHDEATAGVFTIPFSPISAFSLLSDEITQYLRLRKFPKAPDNCIVVSPDQGGVERARTFGTFMHKSPEFDIAVIEKNRDKDRMHVSEATNLYGDVAHKIAILVDDVVTSAETLINAARLVKERGAEQVIAVVTHHDFGRGAPEKLQNSPIDALFTTDSIVFPIHEQFEKMHEISIAPLIAEYIRNISA